MSQLVEVADEETIKNMSYNPFTLEEKTILVTGASSGIGQATAIECSRLGAKVIITGRNVERLQETFEQLEGEGHQQVVADLTKEEDINLLVDSIEHIDGLVNNAGVGRTKLVNFIRKEDLDYVYQTNLFAAILLTKALLKKKKINKGGSLVFSSSIANFHNDIGNGIYCTSKAAITSFMRSCARELGAKQIRSNAVCPGMVETKMIQDTEFSEDDIINDKKKYALERYGKAEEVAYANIYFLSDASKWVTGVSLVVDGGRLLY